MNSCGKFIEISPLCKEISFDSKKVLTDVWTDDGQCENIMPPSPTVGAGIELSTGTLTTNCVINLRHNLTIENRSLNFN